MTTEVHVKGLAELQQFLDQLPAKLEKNVMRGGLRAGMKVVLPQARQNIHSVSGELAAGLKISTRARSGFVIASLKSGGPHGFVARFVEYGTAAHFIAAGPGGGLRMPNNQVVAGVMHPGAAPRPFMRPALDSQASAAVVATGEYVKQRLSTKEGLDATDVEIAAEA